MTRLGGLKPRYAQIAELRYMAGLTIGETAEVLSVSHATVEREWGFAAHGCGANFNRQPQSTPAIPMRDSNAFCGDLAERVTLWSLLNDLR